MATDSNFVAVGGVNIDIGLVGWAIPGGPALFPLEIGAMGLGTSRGVFGLIDDGSLAPGSGLPTGSSYFDSSAMLGAAPKVVGVAGVSTTSVGVFGQGGTFAASLPPGLNCGVLGTATGQAGVMGFSDTRPGVSGTSDTGNGVFGRSNAGDGVFGTSAKAIGVHGRFGTGGPGLIDPQHPKPDTAIGAGVFGTGPDVIGVGGTSSTSIGVLGQTGKAPAFDAKATYTAGVAGTSRDASGIIGLSQNNTGVVGISGTGGPAVPNLGQLAGVTGSSDKKTGVIGTSNFIGVFGFCGGAKGVGVTGQAIDPTSYAGYFSGNVIITGALTATVKNAVVPFPDGSQRVLHCMESPEHWFEDFGAAKLVRGRAIVRLDADFAKVIKRGDFHVFLTPRADCGGLYVRRQDGTSFEVRELMGGKSSVAFSYRIVGRRKDITAHRRFAKIDMTPPMLPTRRTGRTQPSVDALLARLSKQAGAKSGRARRRKRARSPQRLPALLAKLRKQAGAKSARRRKRALKRA
jgi:hypothetical protein